MGWLLPEEQRLFKHRYGVDIFFICNGCNQPILDMPVVDPKGGYHRWSLYNSQPKITYHQKVCAQTALGSRHKEDRAREKYAAIVQTMQIILDKIKKRPEKKWTKERVIAKLAPVSPRIVGRALRELKKEKKLKTKGGGYVRG